MALWPCLGPPLPTRTTPCGPATRPWPCRPPCSRYAEEVRRTHGLEVQIRVGLNAGEVVVRAIGNDLHMDYSAVGRPHIWPRVWNNWPRRGASVCTAATLRLAEGLVQVTALGPVPVKGLAEPVEVFELVGATAVRRRLQAAVARGLTPFVGRQPELAALHQALARARRARARWSPCVGEAGVGKSRLVYEFLHSHHTQGWLRAGEQPRCPTARPRPTSRSVICSKRYCHVEDRDDARTVRAKVTGQMLTLDEPSRTPSPLCWRSSKPCRTTVRSSLDLRSAASARSRRSSACSCVRARCSRCSWSLKTCTGSIRRRRPLLDSLVESLPTARLLLLVNYRPEYQHGWGSKTYYTQLRLDPLPPASADAFLHALLGDDPGLGRSRAADCAHAGQSLLPGGERAHPGGDRCAGRRAGRLSPGASRRNIQVPATVQAVLAARIDRLPPEEKRLLQTAAVIGTEVPLPLLQAIADAPEEACTAAWHTSKRRSSSTRPACFPSAHTPSSMP